MVLKGAKNILLLGTALAASQLYINIAYGQSAVDVPGSADVGQTENSVPSPSFGSVSGPQINIPEVRVENAPDGSDSIKFTLNSVNLVGVTAYDVAELQQIWAGQLGTTVTLTDVYAIAQQITRKYRNDGYIITQAVIPQQTIDGGNVQIQVVEGFIDNVSLQDAEDTFASQRVLSLAENLTKANPLTASALERWLLIVNDIPGMSARSIISPSSTTVGGADLVIIPEIDTYNASINLDNYGSRYLGPLQLSFAGQINNLFNAADTISLQYVTDPDDSERDYVYGRFALPINNYGTNFGLDLTYSDTTPGFELEEFEVEGYSTLFGVDVTHPFVRTRTQNLFGTLRFDYRNLTSKNIVDSFKTKDDIAALRATLGYSVFDTLWRPAVNEVSFTLSQGLDVFNASKGGDANMTRENGEPQFTKVNMDVSRLQTLTPTLSLYTGLTGQMSNDPLLSSEEFGVGGRAFGRGYDSSEIVGDDGFGATAELRWKPGAPIDLMQDYELFGFYDFGKIWNQETEINNIEKQSLASIGVGVRADFTDVINGELLLAQPLTKDVSVYENRNTKLLFSLGANF